MAATGLASSSRSTLDNYVKQQKFHAEIAEELDDDLFKAEEDSLTKEHLSVREVVLNAVPTILGL